MVDVVLVDDNLGVAAFYEFLHEFLGSAVVYVNGIDFGAWHRAVAHFAIGEIESILEYLYFVVYFIFVLRVLYARLHQVVEVNLRASLVGDLSLDMYSCKSQKYFSQECSKLAYRP